MAKQYSKLQLEAIWRQTFGDDSMFNMECTTPRCKTMLTPFSFEVCHDIAKARGGSDDLSNLFAGCSLCNKRQGRNTRDEFHRMVTTAFDDVQIRGRRVEIALADIDPDWTPTESESDSESESVESESEYEP